METAVKGDLVGASVRLKAAFWPFRQRRTFGSTAKRTIWEESCWDFMKLRFGLRFLLLNIDSSE